MELIFLLLLQTIQLVLVLFFFIILLCFSSGIVLSPFNNSILPPVGNPNLNDSGSFGGTCVSGCSFNSEGSFNFLM